MALETKITSKADMNHHLGEGDSLVVSYHGTMNADTTGRMWNLTHELIHKNNPKSLVIDAGEITYCDGAGLALLFHLGLLANNQSINFRITNLDERFDQLLKHFDAAKFIHGTAEKRKPIRISEEVGRTSIRLWHDFKSQISFIGELSVVFIKMLFKPLQFRWINTLYIFERVGVNAVGIICLVGTLFGLILAFTGVITLNKFGAEIYVANMSSIAIVRVLGPFLTAIMLTGRSGSAFAAEIGTMKINEEIDALTMMGIDPMRFLVLPRVLAATIATPLLAMLANLSGLVGTTLVLFSLKIPLAATIDRMKSTVELEDLFSGLLKAVVFGILIGAVGCLRGMETEAGSSAVGESATRAVVSTIVLIIAAEGVFAVLFYFWGI